MRPRPRLALVPGEPAGVGPELVVRLLQVPTAGSLVAFADADVLREAAARLSLPLTLIAPDGDSAPGVLPLQPFPLRHPVHPGRPDPANAAATIAALRAAAAACERGELAGLVTGPLHKAVINAGGIPYTGTTELLATWAGCEVVMMLANDRLRVALATTHLPLRAVADALTPAVVERGLRILDHELRRRFGIACPRILVLGLNPHAGEDGHLGREEIEIITPVLERLRAQGLQLEGPLPADTAFLPHRLARGDAVFAMYHDQGLPVLKYSGFEQGINITLGLPYPRVAVDHGTALDIAGRGLAAPDSLVAAAALCARLAGAGPATEIPE
jgi:4-hydroxythreonine-4-phosphate dehydrogenase